MPGIPLYKSIYHQIKQSIKEGKYPVGSYLPTENELCTLYDASRTTIRKAVGMLSDDGYLNIRQGRGTEVLQASTTQELSHITSITETLHKRGYAVTIHGMSIQKVSAPDLVVDQLQLAEGEEVFKVERLLYADDRPIAYVVNYLKESLVPDLDRYCNAFIGLYSFLEHTYGIVPTEATETLSAAVADFTESQLLHVPQGTPLLCSKRLSGANGVLFEYCNSKLVADRYEYSIRLEGRNHGK